MGHLYSRQPPKHAASQEAIARIINHVANNMSYHDVQVTDVQLKVLGKNQKVTWSRLWEDYLSKCDQEKVPYLGYNSYREIGQMRFPGIQLYKNSVASKAPKQMQAAKRISNNEV